MSQPQPAPTPIDAASALALIADLYHQLTDIRHRYAALGLEHERLLATVRAAEKPDEAPPAAPPTG